MNNRTKGFNVITPEILMTSIVVWTVRMTIRPVRRSLNVPRNPQNRLKTSGPLIASAGDSI
jgi:hypothetical protein